MCKLSLSLLSPKFHKISSKSHRNLKNIDLQSLSNTFSQKLLSLPSYQDTNEQVISYNDSLKDVLDDFAPLTTKLIQHCKTLSWYSPEIKDAKKLCRKLERLWKKSKLIVHELACKKKCAEFNKLLYKSKRSYLHAIINECNDTKNYSK